MHAAFAPLVAVRNIYWLHTDSWSCEIVVIESILAQIHLCVYATALNTGFDISCGVFILFHCQLQLNLCWLCHVHGWSTGLSRIFRFEPTRRWPQSLQVIFILIFGSLCLGKKCNYSQVRSTHSHSPPGWCQLLVTQFCKGGDSHYITLILQTKAEEEVLTDP